MSETKPSSPLSADLRRMLPVWGIVIGTAVLAVFSMRGLGERHIRAAAASTSDSCEYARVYIARGMVLVERIRQDAAPVILENIRPGEPSLGVLAGNRLLDDARDAFSRASELCPAEPEASMQLAVVEWYAGNETASYAHLGNYLLTLGRQREAIINFEVALERDPSSVSIRAGLILALIDAGRLADGVGLAAGHEDRLATIPRGMVALGFVATEEGRLDDGIEYLSRALRETPADLKAVRQLARLGDTDERSRRIADHLVANDQEGRRSHPEALHIAAINYTRLGDFERAERALRRALTLAPNQVVLHFDHAVSLHRLGRRSAARDAIRRALEIDSARVLQMIEDAGVDPR